MKKLVLFAAALGSVILGIWLGLQGTFEKPSTASQAVLGGDFTLNSADGPVSLSDFRGKVVAVYFGYTHCPDVCITSLNKVASALKQLTDQQTAQIQPIFVSVDPERDTPEKTGIYAAYFHPQILGLSGSVNDTAEIAQRYRVIYEKVFIEGSAMDYSVDHSSIVYVIGRDGKLRNLIQHAEGSEVLADALRSAL